VGKWIGSEERILDSEKVSFDKEFHGVSAPPPPTSQEKQGEDACESRADSVLPLVRRLNAIPLCVLQYFLSAIPES